MINFLFALRNLEFAMHVPFGAGLNIIFRGLKHDDNPPAFCDV